MKKIISFFLLASLLVVISCNNKPAETTKEVIVVPQAPTVTLDKNGVKVETKKIDVQVKK